MFVITQTPTIFPSTRYSLFELPALNLHFSRINVTFLNSLTLLTALVT